MDIIAQPTKRFNIKKRKKKKKNKLSFFLLGFQIRRLAMLTTLFVGITEKLIELFN